MSALTNTQGLCLVFHKLQFYPCDYNVLMLNMVETTRLPVNDESLTSAREITIDVDDSQGTLVQSTECE